MHVQPIDHMSEDAYITRAEGGYQADGVAPTNALDDVFGSAPSSPALESAQHDALEDSHPSDMQRLRREHETSGYREGLTAAKETSLQEGFDEGFSLGASIGMRVGQILGTLEGIVSAVRGLDSDAAKHVRDLERDAQRELDAGSVFHTDYWHGDGNWKFEVGMPGHGEQQQQQQQQQEDSMVFADVANSHPLVQKWAAVVDEQVALWKIDRTILDDETGERVDAVVDEPMASSAVTPNVKKPLDW